VKVTAVYYAITCVCVGFALGFVAPRGSSQALEIARTKQQIADIEECNARVIKVACALEAPRAPAYCETVIQCPDGGHLRSGCRP
jgi:hypothetical protein